MNNIKERLVALKLSQVWLLKELRGRGVDVQPPFLSSAVNGVYTFPKAIRVLNTCDEILKEVENGTNPRAN